MFLKKIVLGFSFVFCLSSEAKLISISDINDYWNNNISYVNETNQDIWQTPDITFNKKSGDCEDFAIIKYYNLLNLGINDKDLFFYWVLLEDISDNIKTRKSHIVLVYKKDNKNWVLDNYSKDIVELKDRTDIVKVFAKFNHDFFYTTRKNNSILIKWRQVDKNHNKNILFFDDL